MSKPEAPAPLVFLELRNGIHVCVPAHIGHLTTFALLEREAWFEPETGFLEAFLQPGMTVVDYGADCGIYVLPAARKVGATGRVVAIESDEATARRLQFGAERSDVAVDLLVPPADTLVPLADIVEGGRLDLVRIAGQGAQTIRLLHESQPVFAATDPVLLIEMTVETAEDQEGDDQEGGREGPAAPRLTQALAELGLGLYRWLPVLGFAVPVDPDLGPDRMDLNLLAMSAGRALQLQQAGLLATEAKDAAVAPDGWRRLAETRPGYAGFLEQPPTDDDEVIGLAFHAAAHDRSRPVTERYGAAVEATMRLVTLANRDQSVAARLSAIRAALDLRLFPIVYEQLNLVARHWSAHDIKVERPFLPVTARFDDLKPQGPSDKDMALRGFLEVSATELGYTALLQPAAAGAMRASDRMGFGFDDHRRALAMLDSLDAGLTEVRPGLLKPKPDWRNRGFWESGLIGLEPARKH